MAVGGGLFDERELLTIQILELKRVQESFKINEYQKLLFKDHQYSTTDLQHAYRAMLKKVPFSRIHLRGFAVTGCNLTRRGSMNGAGAVGV